MKLLFISRAYPPVIGGIENHNYELARHFPHVAETTLLVNTRGKKFLPFFLPYALLKTVFTARRYDAILFGDGVLSVIGFFVKLFSPKVRVASVVHGLDITYGQSSFIYRFFWVNIFLPSLDQLLAVSQETKNIAIQNGLDEKRITVIPNGTAVKATPERYSRQDLLMLLGQPEKGQVFLVTNGRLAKRKGAAWFIHNVLGTLPPNIHYILSGAGPEEANVKAAIAEHGLEDRITLLGRTSDDTKLLLLHTADIFIQPNIVVPGDMEGFGIAVIEAAACARPILASNIEGLKDALANGAVGIPLPSGDTSAWRDAILDLARDSEKRMLLGKAAQSYTYEHFSWDTIVKTYVETLQKPLA
jgi:phosphatidylinositol alpha-1,6-mannosyltransferase